ncbi:MAG: ROK family protein [Erysipelotrichaceae bacterium]
MLKPIDLNNNCRAIIECIIKYNEISQNEIANKTKINRSIVSKEMINLKKMNLIKIEPIKNKNVISFNHKFSNTIIIEIDRYFIHAFLNTSLGYNIEMASYKIDVLDVVTLFSKLEMIIDEFIDKATHSIIGIGIAVHGIVDKQHSIRFAPNTDWNNLNLKSSLENKYNIFTTVVNVANVTAVSEAAIADLNDESLLSVTVHSGVGAGFIFNDKLFIGDSGYSLELGHFGLWNHESLCSCGSKGCLETEISYPQLINKMIDQGIEDASIDKLVQLYNENNEIILPIYNEYLSYLAYGLRNLFLIIDPAIIKINCQILQQIPKSIEILKTKIYSPIIKYQELSVSNLNSATRMFGLSIILCQGYLNLSKINMYNSKKELLKSYK